MGSLALAPGRRCGQMRKYGQAAEVPVAGFARTEEALPVKADSIQASAL